MVIQQWQPVRRWRAAAVSGALVALIVVVAFWIRPVPDGVVSMLGVQGSGVARFGGVQIRYRPPAGSDAIAIERELAQSALTRVDGSALVLDFPEVPAQMAPELAAILVNGLTMRRVLETDDARTLARYAPDGVILEDDRWDEEMFSEHRRGMHLVPYLSAPSRAQLERTLAQATANGWRPTDGSAIALERQEANARHGLTWRTYGVSRTADIPGRMIATASASDDPNTGVPRVLLELTPEGGQRFCDLTTQIVGHKLAILLGDRVRSAPVIANSICGGRAAVTMGGSDLAAQEAERDLVVAALSRRTPPPGGTVDAYRWYPPAEIAATEWVGRLLLGMGSGGLVALLVALTLAVARPSERVRGEAVAGRFPWRRLAVTLLGPVALIVGGQLAVPGIDTIQLDHVLAGATAAGRAPRSELSVVMLGVLPILSSFATVELVALGFPSLRWRRHDPQGRVALVRAVAVVTCFTTLVQGYLAAGYLETLTRGGVDVVISPGWSFRIVYMLTLSTGTLLLGIVAGVISTYGLGNGYGVLLASTMILKLARPLVTEPAQIAEANRGHALGLIGGVAIVVATASALRWRIRGGERAATLAVPSSGFAPLSGAGEMVFSAISLVWLVAGAAMTDVMARVNELRGRVWLGFALSAVLVLVWSWLLAAPARTTRVAQTAGFDSTTRRTWARATLLSAVLLVGVAALVAFVATTSSSAAALADPVLAMLGTAVVLDAIADGRAHRRALAPAGALHQIQLAGLVELALAEAGIPCHIHASHLRTLFAYFGPWAPAIVLVPVAQAADARRRLDDLLRPLTARRADPRSALGDIVPSL